MKQLSVKNRGSALLTSLIFAFVIMIVISSLAYNFRIGTLSINSLANQNINTQIDEGYIHDNLFEQDFTQAIDENIDDARFVTTPTRVEFPFLSNSSAKLYEGEPFFASYELEHNFFYESVLQRTVNMIINEIEYNNFYTQYEEDIYPINVPYLNRSALSSQDATHKLDNGEINESQIGYIGYLMKDGTNLDYSVSGNTGSLAIPNDINTDYKFSVGWDIVDGLRSFFLAVYNSDKVYTSSTTLDNLLNHGGQATTDLGNFELITGIPSGSTIASGSIILTKWYHDNSQAVPKPLILRKIDRSGDHELDAYSPAYNSGNNSYEASLFDTFTSDTDFSSGSVFIVSPDWDANLGSAPPLVIENKNLLDFNRDGNYRFGDGTGSTNTQLQYAGEFEPLLVRRNESELFLILYDTDYLYRYIYSSANNPVLAITPLTSYAAGGAIHKVIVRFGALFIFNNAFCYVVNFDDNAQILSRLNIASDQNYQVLRDGSGEIYIMPNGLECMIDGNCNSANRIYISSGCTGYDCSAVAKLNSLSNILGLIYEGTD